MPASESRVVYVVGSGAVAPHARSASSTAMGQRIAHFDFVKGALVLLMVLYHWLNYFIGLDWGGYRYLRFLTPSFILVTGFLISQVYLSRYAYDDARLHRRLIGRGLKLLLLFIGLNVVVELTVGGRLGLRLFDPSTLVAAARAVFVDGTPLAAFDILVSIAYFLLLAPVALMASKYLRVPLIVLAAVAVGTVAAASLMAQNNPHLEMLSIALVGLAAGTPSGAPTVARLRAPIVIVPLYLVYLATITVWNTPFSLQVVGVCLSLLLIDAGAIAAGDKGWRQRRTIRMGQYSLLAYVVQIAVLQLLRRAFRGAPLSGFATVIPLGLTLVLTVTIVELTVALRRKSQVVDRTYRLVFA